MAAAMRHFLARATVILFALRALLPVGFMPDLDALGGGRLDIVLCTAQGDAPLPLDAGGAPAKPHGSPGVDCPFGMALAKTIVAPILPALPQAAAPIATVTRADPVAALRPPSQGPPLGSRAPPILPA
jgi:hypothetical protein